MRMHNFARRPIHHRRNLMKPFFFFCRPFSQALNGSSAAPSRTRKHRQNDDSTACCSVQYNARQRLRHSAVQHCQCSTRSHYSNARCGRESIQNRCSGQSMNFRRAESGYTGPIFRFIFPPCFQNYHTTTVHVAGLSNNEFFYAMIQKALEL